LAHFVSGVTFSDGTEVNLNAIGQQFNCVVGFVELHQFAARMQGTERYIESAFCLLIHLNTCLKALESRQADLEGATFAEGVDAGDVAIFYESAEIGFDAVEFLEGGPCGLPGIDGVFVNYKHIEGRRHCVVPKSMQVRNSTKVFSSHTIGLRFGHTLQL
jgi:hypothetical protein